MQGALYSMGAVENLEKTPASCQPLVANRCNLHYNTCIMTLKRDRTCLAGCASRITSKIPFLTLRDGSGFVPTHCLVNWIQRRSSSSVHIPAMCSSTELSSGWADNPRILALWGGRWGSNSTTYCVTCAQRLADPTGKSLQEWLGKNPIYPAFFKMLMMNCSLQQQKIMLSHLTGIDIPPQTLEKGINVLACTFYSWHHLNTHKITSALFPWEQIPEITEYPGWEGTQKIKVQKTEVQALQSVPKGIVQA